MRRPTLSDVARASGVSVASVSKALSPHADRCDLSPATRARVIAAARVLGFQPSASHGRRTRRLWRNIGLLWGRFAPFTSGVYEGVLDAIGEHLVDRGWRLLYAPVPEDEPDAWRSMQMAQRLDGVLAVSHVPETVLATLVAERYPAVLLNLQTAQPLPQYLPDDQGGAAALIGHFAGLGHRHVVYLAHRGNGVGHFSEVDRPAAMRQAAERAGMRLSIVPSLGLAEVVALCRADATAVACYDWNDVPVILRAFAEAGLAVPGAVSVACCTDVRWFAFLTPAVTAVRIPMRELAQQALQRLLERIETDSAETGTVILPTALQVRASTGPARV